MPEDVIVIGNGNKVLILVKAVVLCTVPIILKQAGNFANVALLEGIVIAGIVRVFTQAVLFLPACIVSVNYAKVPTLNSTISLWERTLTINYERVVWLA